MPYLMFLMLAAIPLAEIFLLIQVGKTIGVWWTILVVIATATAGTYVLHRQGFTLMNRVIETMAAGKPPVAPVIEGGFLMLAGMLLIMPGLITDSLGMLLLIPKLRHIVAAWSVRRLFRSMTVRTAAYQQSASTEWAGQGEAKQHPHRSADDTTYAPGDGPVIDGEFERLGERSLDPRRTNGDARRTPPDAPPPPPRH